MPDNIKWSVRLLSLTSMPQVILLLAPQNLPSLGRRPSIPVSPQFSFCTNHAWNSGGNSFPLSSFSHRGGSAVECRYRRCVRDGIPVSAHLCRTSTVQCGTHTRVFCRTRRRAGPLAVPTSCFLVYVFSPLTFYTIGTQLGIFKFNFKNKIIIIK